MLLTSSQVSIAASSSVVVIFTTALFLSGYVIQQRTLRDLREAIKPSPRPKPQIFLPDRFKTTTTELQDGTVIVVDVDLGPDAYRPPRPDPEQVVVEVRPTVASEETQKEEQRVDSDAEGSDDVGEVLVQGKDGRLPPDGGAERQGDGKKEGKMKPQKKLSRVERRRQIKEEIQRLAQGSQRGVYQPRLW